LPKKEDLNASKGKKKKLTQNDLNNDPNNDDIASTIADAL
jgi:hypothetical protein